MELYLLLPWLAYLIFGTFLSQILQVCFFLFRAKRNKKSKIVFITANVIVALLMFMFAILSITLRQKIFYMYLVGTGVMQAFTIATSVLLRKIDNVEDDEDDSSKE